MMTVRDQILSHRFLQIFSASLIATQMIPGFSAALQHPILQLPSVW
jgi:hypothetical protein